MQTLSPTGRMGDQGKVPDLRGHNSLALLTPGEQEVKLECWGPR